MKCSVKYFIIVIFLFLSLLSFPTLSFQVVLLHSEIFVFSTFTIWCYKPNQHITLNYNSNNFCYFTYFHLAVLFAENEVLKEKNSKYPTRNIKARITLTIILETI